uniref:Uncharacterized protein n=1 Tax=viral metagenome TaxID=1070528 RepID=A0A6C0I2V1_9ZZZZ
MATTNNLAFSLSAICNQRARQQLYAPKPIRLEMTSPYTGQFTKTQLDMRRKAEILQYKSNASSTQTNSLTKAQKWAQIANGKGQRSAYTQLVNYVSDPATGSVNTVVTNVPNYTCENDDLIPTPSYACGVPGPITYFIRDVNVPLYGYATNTDSYAITKAENTDPWTVSVQKDIFLPSTVEMELLAINIRSYIRNSFTTFSIQMPISLYISSFSSLPIATTGLSLIGNKLQITNIAINVYYNGQFVTNKCNIVSPTLNTPYTFDIVCNPTVQSFSNLINLGVLYVQNLGLYTTAGYIYDVKAVVTVAFTPSNSDTYSNYFAANTSYGVYCNLSTPQDGSVFSIAGN